MLKTVPEEYFHFKYSIQVRFDLKSPSYQPSTLPLGSEIVVTCAPILLLSCCRARHMPDAGESPVAQPEPRADLATAVNAVHLAA